MHSLSSYPMELSNIQNAVAISNCRAEPTTEFVKEKQLRDVQPYTVGDWTVVHNGTIANDKELIAQYGLEVETLIDSAVLPALLDKQLGEHFDQGAVTDLLFNDVVGSFAVAITHALHPSHMFLACNYKPLYLGYHRDDKYWIFSSQKEYIVGNSLTGQLANPISVIPMPAYSTCMLSRDMEPRQVVFDSLYPYKVTSNKKALVVCSGGLDSTVVAAKAIQEGYEVTLLHFLYSCRAEDKEKQAILDIAEYLKCEYMFVTTDMFKNVIKGSPLTNTATTEFADGVAGAEFAHEWIPARNLIMLSIATGIAESHGFGTIMLGNNLEESGAYPDNEMEFINRLNDVLPYAVAANKRVRIEMPVGNLMKHEIVKLGLGLNAPMHLTWSCYNSGDKECGNCGPCFMKHTAFKINGENFFTWRPKV